MNATPSPASRLPLAVLLACVCGAAADAPAETSWAFAPGFYSHSPESGQRVVQYAQHEPVEGLPDPRQTVSRYWRTRTNLPGAAGSNDSIYEVRSFGNTLGGFDAQRERGHDAQLETLDALTPFRNNPFLFFGGMQGFGYGYPGYPAAPPGTPVPSQSGQAPQGAPQAYWAPPMAAPQAGPVCVGEGCTPTAPSYTPSPQPYSGMPYPGMPGAAWPYAPQNGFVAPMPYAVPFPFWGGGAWGGGGWNGGGWGGGGGWNGGGWGGGGNGQHPGWRPQPWSGYGPGRQSHFQGGGW